MSKELVKLALKELASSNPEDSIKLILNHKDCQHTTQVKFALHCAKDSLKFIDQAKEPAAYESSLKCTNLVEQWLNNPSSVSKEELEKAAQDASYASAYSAASAASAYSAYAAAYSATKDNKFKEYLHVLVLMVLKENGEHAETLELLYG